MGNKKVKTRGDVAPGKIQTNMRLYERCYNALQADAERRGFGSAPGLLNHILTVLYFGTQQEKSKLIGGR